MRLTVLAAGLCLASSSWVLGSDEGPTVDGWRDDLSVLVETLERVHPDPHAHVSAERFEAITRALSTDLPTLDRRRKVVRLMEIVAALEDGHTTLDPTGGHGFDAWYPLRLYRFSDGIFVTACAAEHAAALGARVLTIGGRAADDVWREASRLVSADNELGRAQATAVPLSNAGVLVALGIVAEDAPLDLRVHARDGRDLALEIPPVAAPYDDSFRFWGETWGPASDAVEYVAWDGRSSDDFYDRESELPLHLRFRSAHWFSADHDGWLYAQINFMGDSRRIDTTFARFTEDLFRAFDERRPEMLVLDLRYNIGGDGSLVNDFVHELIKREDLLPPGALFTIVGRATYSAGVMLAQALEEHTDTLFVGEPAGAYWDHYGDGTSFTLPASGLTVWSSTIHHQLSAYTEGRRVMPVHLPAVMSGADYFAGRDPALEAIHRSRSRPPLATVFRDRPAAEALAEYELRQAEIGDVPWWEPFSLAELDTIGDELTAAGRTDDALAAYELNTRRHPDHWRSWRNLGRAYRQLDRNGEALAAYRRSLEVDPYSNLAPHIRDEVAEIEAELATAESR